MTGSNTTEQTSREPRPAGPPRKPFNPYRAASHTAPIPFTRSYVTKTQGLSNTGSSSATPVGGAPSRASRTRGQTSARASLATAATHSQHRRVTSTQPADTRTTCPTRGRTTRHWALKWSVALATVVSGASATVVKAVAVTGSSASANPLKGAAGVAARCGSSPGETPCSWWRGINLYSGFSDQLGSPQASAAIQTISSRDANNYVVYVPELDTAPDGTVSVGSKAISDDHLVSSAQGASSGSAAVLKPHISDPTNFAGGPGFVSSYSAVLEHYGRVATQMRAKVFVITTELTQIYRDPAAMNALIDAASRTYTVPGGRIAVAINWDQLHEALTFPWLGRVSLVGIDGYWPVGTSASDGSVASIYAQWKQPATQSDGAVETPGQAVAGLAALGKDVVFTEIGYQGCQGSAASPSTQPDPSNPASCGATTPDPREQQAATQAAYCYWTQWAREHGDPSWFRGLWWWDWDLSGSANVWDVKSGAEGVIRSWNTGGGGSCPSLPA
ncbi:MAG TPA: hypothetical protein VMU90_08225 [Solirubrobacteraceae bacterium]|nr:hypothetical protein [Solirubrobacteraceae bacterium]